MSGWLKLDDAAKQHPAVDLWVPYPQTGERVTNARWSAAKQAWVVWSLGDFDTMEWVKINGAPTHYMLPPAPPGAPT